MLDCTHTYNQVYTAAAFYKTRKKSKAGAPKEKNVRYIFTISIRSRAHTIEAQLAQLYKLWAAEVNFCFESVEKS